MKSRKSISFFLSIAFWTACAVPPGDLECENATGTVSGQVISGETSQLVSRDLMVQGTAMHSQNLTIRQVLVAGVTATNKGFNFETWSVVVPVGALASLPREEDGTVIVEVKATDACLRTHSVASFSLLVDPDPQIDVQNLELAVELPGGESYLPATGNIPAVLSLTANPEAANAVVTLTATQGSFKGTSDNQLLLAGDRQQSARATALFIPQAPGTVVITATAKSKTTLATLKVVGPPALSPSGAMLSPGQSVRVTVLTEGRVVACQATPAQGISVTSGGVDLMSRPGGSDVTQDNLIDVDVSAAAGATQAATTELTCRDAYGQSATGSFMLVL